MLVATDIALRGNNTRAARPAAAADGSKWPMFDFSDAHWTRDDAGLEDADNVISELAA